MLISLRFNDLSFYIFKLCGVAYLCSGSIIENGSVIVE